MYRYFLKTPLKDLLFRMIRVIAMGGFLESMLPVPLPKSSAGLYRKLFRSSGLS